MQALLSPAMWRATPLCTTLRLALRWGWALAFFLVLGLIAGGVQAQTALVPVPALTAQVLDETGTLTPAQRQQITTSLEAIERQHGSQVVVLMVATTAPEDIAAYANRVASTWKIGRKDVGDGLLFIIAKNDRTLRLEVARGLEGTIPDIAAGRIIQEQVVPQLRQGDFAAAISSGLSAIERRLAGDDLLPAPMPAPAPRAPAQSFSGGLPESFWPVVFFGVPVVCNLLARWIGRFLTMLLSGGVVGLGTFLVTRSWPVSLLFGVFAGFVALTVTGGPSGKQSGGRGSYGRSGGWSSGGGSRSSGGGFSSGGGGSFGGGGASGKW